MNVTQSLPSIRKVYMVEAAQLAPNILEKYLAGLSVGVYPLPTEIEQYGTGSCSAEQELDEGSIVESTTLSFNTAEEVTDTIGKAFVVGDNNGKYWLIGQREKPYPVVTVSKSIEDNSTINTVKVTYRRQKSLIPCNI